MSDSDPTVAPLPNMDHILSMIADLKQNLEANIPEYAIKLHTIHKMLAEDEALSHLLSEEQIGVICEGLSRRKGIVVATAEVKKSKGKKLSGYSASDLE